MKKIILIIVNLYIVFVCFAFADDAMEHFKLGKRIIEEENCPDCYKRSKEGIENGIKELKKAIELNPNLGEAYISLGIGYWNYSFFGGISDPSEVEKIRLQAHEKFRKAVELLPYNARAHERLSFSYGAGLHDHNNYMIELEKAIKLDQNNVDYIYNYGSGLFDEGKIEEGIAEIKKAISISPKERYIRKLAETYFKLGRYSEALEWFQKITSKESVDGQKYLDYLRQLIKEQGGTIPPPEEGQKVKEDGKKPENVSSVPVLDESSKGSLKLPEQKHPLPAAPEKKSNIYKSKSILIGSVVFTIFVFGMIIFIYKKKSNK